MSFSPGSLHVNAIISCFLSKLSNYFKSLFCIYKYPSPQIQSLFFFTINLLHSYELNVSPQIHILKPNPQGDVVRRWGLWQVIGSSGQGCHE